MLAIIHRRIADWNHDYPNRQEQDSWSRESAMWARMREWLWANHGATPSHCDWEDRYQPTRPPSCGALCAEQSQVTLVAQHLAAPLSSTYRLYTTYRIVDIAVPAVE